MFSIWFLFSFSKQLPKKNNTGNRWSSAMSWLRIMHLTTVVNECLNYVIVQSWFIAHIITWEHVTYVGRCRHYSNNMNFADIIKLHPRSHLYPSVGNIPSPATPNSYNSVPPPQGPPDLMSPSSDGPTTSQSTLSPQSPSSELPPLVQSTSFLDSVPVTLTMEPRDWMGVEGPCLPSSNALGAVSKTQPEGRGAVPNKSLEVELRRRPGEGFGFVIATQDMTNGCKCCWLSLLTQTQFRLQGFCFCFTMHAGS